MTPIALALALLLALAFLLLLGAALAVARAMRRRLPRPDAPSDHHDRLTRQLRLAYEQSAERTAALNRDLERLRKGTRYGDD